jgi:4-diphosphocytidyl-2-C-methyl-D-erythritol kinase
VATRVRSYSKINLGLAIGAPRPDGFHSLSTLYQTLALHDFVTISARRAGKTAITLTSNDPRVPCDARNTAWKMVELALGRAGVQAEVAIHIEKKLPVQGGMGAGSANAAAALFGLQRELGLEMHAAEQLEIASLVGSDVPLFLVGGSSLGSDRGQIVTAVPDVTLAGSTEIPCVIALPATGVSTPAAFRDWDRLLAGNSAINSTSDLHNPPIRDRVEELSRAYASVFSPNNGSRQQEPGPSGIFPDPNLEQVLPHCGDQLPGTPEKQQGLSREQFHHRAEFSQTRAESGIEIDLAENSLLALVRTGIENDFETVVFPQYPSLRQIKRYLMGTTQGEAVAVYAALSGSGSALFGLYRSQADADAAQQGLQSAGVEALVTTTMPRDRYFREMFAE